MFLCDTCHDESACEQGFIEGFLRSRGPCERCHAHGAMRDCHGYNFSPLSNAKIDDAVARMWEAYDLKHYEEYGAVVTSGPMKDALRTREWCEAHAVPFEPLYRKVTKQEGDGTV